MQERRHQLTKSSLTQKQARLVDLMQRLNFGRINKLHIRDSEPQFTPPPQVLRDVRPGRINGPRPEADKSDFALKAEVIEMFAQLAALGDGTIECIEVQHGLPFKLTIEEDITE